ncbi:MmcQ/YjbR family DNA-binding protein [Paenibacillus chartarius]|uniref:MmcQ/YjbR family DNA-binding protein n=1 Tax=Paenibacillus chartarius TaxID=747481 RepID=A0ABV6DVI0_9BACL
MSSNAMARTPAFEAMLSRIRTICTGLPEVAEEVDGHGHTVFRGNGKTFIFTGDHNLEQTPGLSVKTDKENQELLIASGKYTKTPYIGQHGWVSIHGEPDWDELADLVEESYLRVAPKKLAKQVQNVTRP